MLEPTLSLISFSVQIHAVQLILLVYAYSNDILNRSIEVWELKSDFQKIKNSTPGADNITVIWFKNLDYVFLAKIIHVFQHHLIFSDTQITGNMLPLLPSACPIKIKGN